MSSTQSDVEMNQEDSQSEQDETTEVFTDLEESTDESGIDDSSASSSKLPDITSETNADSDDDESSENDDDDDDDNEDDDDDDNENDGDNKVKNNEDDISEEDTSDKSSSESDSNSEIITTESTTKNSAPKKYKRRGRKGQKIRAAWNTKENKGYVNFVKQVYSNSTINLFLFLDQIIQQSYESKTAEDNRDSLLDAEYELDTDQTVLKENELNDDTENGDAKLISFSADSKKQITMFLYQKFSLLLKNSSKIRIARMTSKSGKRLQANDIKVALALNRSFLGFMDPVQTLYRLDGTYKRVYLEMLLCQMRHTPKNIPNSGKNKSRKSSSKNSSASKKSVPKAKEEEGAYDEYPLVTEEGVYFTNFSLVFKPKCTVFDKQVSKRVEQSKQLFGEKRGRKKSENNNNKKETKSKATNKRSRKDASLSESESINTTANSKKRQKT